MDLCFFSDQLILLLLGFDLLLNGRFLVVVGARSRTRLPLIHSADLLDFIERLQVGMREAKDALLERFLIEIMILSFSRHTFILPVVFSRLWHCWTLANILRQYQRLLSLFIALWLISGRLTLGEQSGWHHVHRSHY